MNWLDLVWTILALMALLGLFLLILFAVIEPGPLEEQRKFGAPRSGRASEKEDQAEDAAGTPERSGDP